MNILPSLKRNAGALLLASLFSPVGYGQISFTGNYSQNFDGMISSGNVTTSSSNLTFTQYAIPSTNNSTFGWSATRVAPLTGGNATAFTADTGASNSGLVYSYGSSNSTDRALGLLASGSNTFAVGAEFLNTSNATITTLTITYTGEYWRSSSSTQNTLTFAYGFSGGSATSANYLSNTSLGAFSGLDLVGPVPVTTNGALNGNASGNQTVFTSTLAGLEWAPGTSLYIRWTDKDDVGNDAGLAIDNFNMTGLLFTGKDVPIFSDTTFTQNNFGGNLTFTNLDNAVFNGSATTVSLGGNVTANGLKFNTDGYTLAGAAGNVLTLTSGAITTQTGVNATITADLAGPTGLTKVGPGTLNISGNNTFVGSVGVYAGQLNISSDSNLGAASNGIVLGGKLATTGSLSLGAGRTVSGSGVIETGASQSLTLAGNVSAASLTVNGASTIAFSGTSKTVGSLSIAQPASISVGGSALAITSNLTLAGVTTLTGPLDFGGSGPTLQVTSGSFTPSGNISTTSRIIKTGAGLLDLTSTTLTAPGTSAGMQLGVQGSSPQEGGTLKIDQATDLGSATPFRFNSGTLNVTVPLSITSGISVGGRTAGVASRPTLAGSPITFTGNNSFFAATSANGDIALVVNNITTINGNFTATVVPTSSNQNALPSTFIDLSGTGTLNLTGNATAIYDSLYVNGGLTLAVNGSLGSDVGIIDAGTTVTGNGTFAGYHIYASGTGNSTVTEVYKLGNTTFNGGSTLAPSGKLKFLTKLTLSPGSNTVLSITGNTSFTSLDVSLPPSQTTITSSTFTKGGSLTINVAAPASSGNYTLITTGGNVTTLGAFNAVYLGGGYSGTLTGNVTVTSGNKTFSYSDSTNLLTIADSAPAYSALETWRFQNFGLYANTGAGADTNDADGDGIPNLIEYATGTNPTAANVLPITLAQAGNFLTLTYPVISDTGITYTVQGTNDLATAFTTGNGTITGNATTKVYTDDVDLSTSGARRFLRLQVSH